MDGNTGRIYCNPAQEGVAAYRQIQEKQRLYTAQLALYAPLAAETVDGFTMRVTANIEMVDEVPLALEYGAQGIGLFRSEYQYLGQKELPNEETLFLHYKSLLTRVAPFPVTVRTLDAGGDKLPIPGYDDGEANPALGLRAIRFSLRRPEIFASQLRALLRAGLFGNLRIMFPMFPMITSVCEVKRIMEIVSQVKDGLLRESIPFADDCQLGIMIEVPSAVSVSDVLARMVDFFSIGTNDLIQYALAIDRGNEHVAHMYEPLHPAVLRMIRQVVDAAHNAGIEVGVCGEMASEVRYLPLLLGLGLDELSMYPLAVPYIKRMLRNSTAEEAEKLVQKVFSCSSAQDVHDLLFSYLPKRYPDEFGDNGLWMMKRSCCDITMSDSGVQLQHLPGRLS
jgi:phosphotransferase system enzyme I (PtsI)